MPSSNFMQFQVLIKIFASKLVPAIMLTFFTLKIFGGLLFSGEIANSPFPL